MEAKQLYKTLREAHRLNLIDKPTHMYSGNGIEICSYKNIIFIFTLSAQITVNIFLYENETVVHNISESIYKYENIFSYLVKYNRAYVAYSSTTNSNITWIHQGSWITYIENYFNNLETEIVRRKESLKQDDIRKKQEQQQQELDLLAQLETTFANATILQKGETI